MSDLDQLPTTAPAPDPVGERLAQLEAQVAAGTRDARTLVLIPPELARQARLTFPVDAFGEPQPW